MNELRGLDFDLDLAVPLWHLAHAESVAQAAVNMRRNVTRTAVSRQIAKFEQQLGFRVFDADKRGQLTEAGAQLLRLLEKFLPELDELVFQLRDAHAPKLCIGSAAAFAQAHWPFLLGKILEFEPRIQAEVITDTEDALLAKLAQRLVQLIVIPLAHPMPREFLKFKLTSLRLAILVHRKSGITSTDQLKVQKRVAYRAALPVTSPTMIHEMRKHLRRLGIQLGPTQACSLIDVLHFVANGHGIGLSLMEPTLITHRNVRVLPIKTWAPLEIGVVLRAPGTALELRVLELLAERARQLFSAADR